MKVLYDSWGWTADSSPPIAGYIHIPFCRHRCGYCNFSLLANRDDLIDRFLDALERELALLETPRPVRTLFLGGGTPSILKSKQLERLLKMLRYWLPLTQIGALNDSTEWSIEANPLDIHDEFCSLCCDNGSKRISIGGQSFDVHKLKTLERDHSPAALSDAIAIAKKHFESVSLDLIFGAPDESHSVWCNDLQCAVDSGIHHISTYGLTYEKGAKFWSLREKGTIRPVDEDSELNMYTTAIDRLEAAGFQHYEVSNFSLPGAECKHNQAYWNGDRWWAFGPSAARFVGNVRSVNHRGTLEYIRRTESGSSAVAESELLTEDQIWRERFVFGMRQRAGVPWKQWRSLAPADTASSIDATLGMHLAAGWICWKEDRVTLTRNGLVISDGLWSDYL